ncbi:hypothetical protein C8A00DRAFT_30523 [Chaetomidium leptoderma]|uniref:Dihydroxyacid dehydratase n=1 Tax=Chaetomidium leptoderma TaxID=669021 RepID=A0AAN6VRM6_9PEZI|nr:hypothetical protein C8A00DRAFT_30523 [Chaetomidium leptoderma]
MAATQSDYDLMIVTDATGSMGTFLDSLNSSLQDIIRISATTDCFSRIGVLAYRDYVQIKAKITQWSGWHSRDDTKSDISQSQLLSFVRTLRPLAGGDWPEATRTGLAHAYQLMRPDAKTIILLYADAPPHTELAGGLWKTEQPALLEPEAYGGAGELFADWTSVARTLAKGEKRAQVFSIIEPGSHHRFVPHTTSMFAYLSAHTGGVCIALPMRPSETIISKVTVSLLLAWMGADKQGAKMETDEIATLVHFVDASGIDQVTSEKDLNGVRYLPVSQETKDKDALKANIARSPLSLQTLSQIIPRREHAVMDFAKRYKADAEYQGIVVEQLAEIIESNVSAIALNPVFGTLWRTVCNDRLNAARDTLITRFGRQVDLMQNAEKKGRLKSWLEESYDWAGEILEMIKSVPEEARYPCVFLDPTVRFSQVQTEADDNDDDSMEFSRDELLEIGRSCDYRILRRLGRILTRLTYVNSKEDLPAHVKDIAESEVPKIPMALAQPAHKRKFWKVLLHLVLPGTMLAARPAALLAALSVRMGIKPLEDAAYSELMAWRGNWNTLDIPETWNTNCLGLLLEVDEKHQQQSAHGAGQGLTDDQTILKAEDRKLFDALVNYKLLEMNMDTTLTAKIGWTPDKNKVPLGPVVVCKSCQFPRSVTLMAEDGVCGLCATPCGCESKEVHETLIGGGVSKRDNAATLATWTECSMTDCRAQYVVYNPKKLNVRAKCHYCRQKGTVSKTDPNYATVTQSPCVTCTTCANRIIYPETYRPADFNPTTYTCPGCTNNHATITTQETTPRTLATENGTAWLLRNDANTIPAPFTNRSLFHTISTAVCCPREEEEKEKEKETLTTLFPARVQILPQPPHNVTLTIRGKPIHNTPSLLTALHSWITARRVQAGLCSLCFHTHPKRSLRLACGGRTGCTQRVCGGCLRGWYGLNRPGAVVNVAALSCPFCRRQPTAAARNGFVGQRGLWFLEGLRDAVEEAGEWVYVWCRGCGCAKRFVERVCARGAPEAPGEGWQCEECVVVRRRRRRRGDDDDDDVEMGGGVRDELLLIKECPACGVATEKAAGCDHISCLCGAHWCFTCGEKAAETAGEIYAHMSEVHRTWYGAGGDEDDGYDEEEEEEEEGEQ